MIIIIKRHQLYYHDGNNPHRYNHNDTIDNGNNGKNEDNNNVDIKRNQYIQLIGILKRKSDNDNNDFNVHDENP